MNTLITRGARRQAAPPVHTLSAAAPGSAMALRGMGRAFLDVPFDALRFQYAGAVVAGLAQRSLLASGQLERSLDTLERLMLGPLARQR